MVGEHALRRRAAASWLEGLAALRIEQLWQLAALVAPIIMTAGGPALTIDSWWGLTMGRLMVEARRPLVDAVVSFGPVAPGSVQGQWLAHVLQYGAYALGGEIGLRLAAGVVAALAFGLVMAAGRIVGGTPRTVAFGALLAVVAVANNLGLRAQLFSYAMFALVYLLLALRHRHPRVLSALPIVFAVWSNLHGAFLAGLLLIGLHAAVETLEVVAGRPQRWREPLGLVVVLGLSVLATSLSPLGFGVYPYIWSIASYSASKSLIPEWQQTTLQDYAGIALAATAVVIGVTLRASRRPVSRIDVAVLLAFGCFALTSQRQVVWWGLAAGPIFARYAAAVPLPRWLAPADDRADGAGAARRGAMNGLFATALLGLALAAPFWRPVLAAELIAPSASTLYAPRGVADAASALPEGARMFVFQPWTGYIAWRLWPHQQSLMDARFETHPAWLWDEYQAISTVRDDWPQLLDRYRVEYLVLSVEQQRDLAHAALEHRRWVQIYADDVGIILMKAD